MGYLRVNVSNCGTAMKYCRSKYMLPTNQMNFFLFRPCSKFYSTIFDNFISSSIYIYLYRQMKKYYTCFYIKMATKCFGKKKHALKMTNVIITPFNFLVLLMLTLTSFLHCIGGVLLRHKQNMLQIFSKENDRSNLYQGFVGNTCSFCPVLSLPVFSTTNSINGHGQLCIVCSGNTFEIIKITIRNEISLPSSCMTG